MNTYPFALYKYLLYLIQSSVCFFVSLAVFQYRRQSGSFDFDPDLKEIIQALTHHTISYAL